MVLPIVLASASPPVRIRVDIRRNTSWIASRNPSAVYCVWLEISINSYIIIKFSRRRVSRPRHHFVLFDGNVCVPEKVFQNIEIVREVGQ